MLLASSSTDDDHEHQQEVFPVVIPIVGIGGLGKTTLAKLVYNDPGIDDCFKLKLWVCVSDVFDIKEITKKILMAAMKEVTQNSEMEQLQGPLRNLVADEKYLLVLDDVWNENRDKWLELRALLKTTGKGSKILVTTRSKEVARIMGAIPFELQGLSEKESLVLLQNMAFEPGEAEHKQHLMGVWKEIVNKCANVPLAIRTVGSLLKFSYQQLWSPLKNCFANCALFPKDYEFKKETLIDLWMPQGFIIPKNNKSQSLAEVAEKYFLILLQRCFFQDIKRDEWGNISSCKMHDLMQDLAIKVVGVKTNLKSIHISTKTTN